MAKQKEEINLFETDYEKKNAEDQMRVDSFMIPPKTIRSIHLEDGIEISNSILTGATINGAITGTGVNDDDSMASASSTTLATDESIKAYIDAQIAAVPAIPTDGYTASTDTWTYASSSTFTIAGVDRTSVYVPGTKLKFTQTGVKYGVVLSSSFSTNTTVTIAVNTDYTIANAAITSPYYSYAETPQGYPGFFNYTPTHGGFSAAPASGIYKFAVKGKTCIVIVRDTAAGTSNATSFTISTPVTSKNTTNYYSGSHAQVQDNGTYSFARVYIPHNSAVITYQKTANNDTAFTASGNKSGEFTLTYEIA